MTGRAGIEAGEEAAASIAVELIAVLVAVADSRPLTMTIDDGQALPSGPFEVGHRSLQSGLRAWVERQTRHPLGYVEQLYTFADSDRRGGLDGARAISISYLGLTRAERAAAPHAGWRPWYDYFPWEDHRSGAPELIGRTIAPALERWAGSGGERAAAPGARRDRLRARGAKLERGTRPPALRASVRGGAHSRSATRPRQDREGLTFGRPMIGDHRRILATGIARVRAKIKYNPVVFELMPPAFTLLQLQRCVEAIAGLSVHKPNFRRLIEQQQLVEETGETVTDTGGRPAKAFRFRPAVHEERAAAGAKLPLDPHLTSLILMLSISKICSE